MAGSRNQSGRNTALSLENSRKRAVNEIIDQLVRTRKLRNPRDPASRLVREPDVEFMEDMRTHIVSVIEGLGARSPEWLERQKRENEEIFEAALALRRVAICFGPESLNNLIEQLENACTFRNPTRADKEDAARRLRRVAKIGPKLADQLEEVAEKLEQAAKLEHSPKSLEQSGMDLKIEAAEEALKLILVFTDTRATKHKGGVFRMITADLLQAAIGGEHNVDRACDAVLRARL